MGLNKLLGIYFLIIMGITGLMSMAFGHTEFSTNKVVLFLIGMILLSIALFKLKSKPKSIQRSSR